VKFKDIFKQIAPEEIPDNVFALVGKILPVITVGVPENCNSMVASGGGMGLLFRKPATWCILASSRYTLEMLEKKQTYTLSYFSDEYREQYMFLAEKSGRDSDKMKEVELTAIGTPLNNTSFKEARLVIECNLAQISVPQINDFYSKETQKYLTEAYQDLGEIRKYVFGEITAVWIKEKQHGD
jgi:flavin reductase (DIM6/NTAB) family NADH-FMN oxidoreductase RutF